MEQGTTYCKMLLEISVSCGLAGLAGLLMDKYFIGMLLQVTKTLMFHHTD
jgi:hypothetical protein